MVRDVTNVGNIVHIIQLSVAPVFLLTGIGTILNVMTNRLGRIIDRARLLEGKLEVCPPEAADNIKTQLSTLSLRSKLIGRAISLCTATALLVCAVIAALFLGHFLVVDISYFVAGLFILAMLLLVMGLLWFLREIFLATARLRIGPQ